MNLCPPLSPLLPSPPLPPQWAWLLAGIVGWLSMPGVSSAGRRSERSVMGSVGSGVAGEQEFAMKSVGTRTTLPRAPPTSRRGPAHRSCSSERPAPAPAPPSEATEGGASSDGRSCSTDRPQLTSDSASSAVSNGDRLPLSNAAFLNGAGRREGPRGCITVDSCGNNVVLSGEKTSGGGGVGPVTQYREGPPVAKTDNHNPPKLLPVSGKLEQVQWRQCGCGESHKCVLH